jgi:hypothetical protein
MAHTCRTARKSTGRLPVGQLAPRNVPQPQESQADIPREATSEEEPFEIELVAPESQLQNSVHYLLPYRKKDQFKAYGVKKDNPQMEMVHHQDVAVEPSTRLLTAQHEIETLHAQLRNADATIQGYMRMVEGQTSDLNASDTDTWTATSSVQSSGKEPAIGSHSPSGSRSR